jgi:hypothetical protein
MHIREARHCVSHCHAGKTTFSTALLRARQASRAPVGVPSATYLLHVPNDNQRRKVTLHKDPPSAMSSVASKSGAGPHLAMHSH